LYQVEVNLPWWSRYFLAQEHLTQCLAPQRRGGTCRLGIEGQEARMTQNADIRILFVKAMRNPWDGSAQLLRSRQRDSIKSSKRRRQERFPRREQVAILTILVQKLVDDGT